MSKAAQKRARKELEKLHGAGRYWEWLAAIEKGASIEEHRGDWQEVWQTLARRALRDPDHLEEFLARSHSIEKRPELPELQLLLLLRKFIEEGEGMERIAAVKGLGFPGEAIRNRLIALKDEAFPEERLRMALTLFLSEPGAVTQKDYEEIAGLLKETPLSAAVKRLGPQMTAVRGLVTRRPKTGFLQKLFSIESTLKESAEGVSPHLRNVLFYPFLLQVNRLVQSFLDAQQEVALAEVVSTIPFLFRMLAGERAESLHRQLRPLNRRPADLPHRERVIHGNDFDEKIALLGEMRSFPPQDNGQRVDLDDLLDLYQSIFSDVQKRVPALSERERKDVGKVMASALAHDLPLVWNGLMGTEHDLVSLLFSAAQTGCFNLRLGVLALVLSEKQGHGRLKTVAEGFLKDQAPPAREDIGWLFTEFGDMVFPRVGFIRPVLSLWRGESALIQHVARVVWSKSLTALVLISATNRVEGLFPFPMPMGGPEKEDMKKEIQLLRKELGHLSEYEAFNRVADYLHCFPEDSLDEAGYRRLLRVMFEKGKGLDSIIEMVGDLPGFSSGPMSRLFPMDIFGDLIRIQENGFFSFLKEHWEDLRKTDLRTLERLVEMLLRKEARAEDKNLLLRISNLLEDRFQAGEKEAGLLKEKLLGVVRSRGYRPRPAGRPKASRRQKELW